MPADQVIGGAKAASSTAAADTTDTTASQPTSGITAAPATPPTQSSGAEQPTPTSTATASVAGATSSVAGAVGAGGQPVQDANAQAKANSPVLEETGRVPLRELPFHDLLGEDVIYQAAEEDSHSGVNPGDYLAGKIVKVVSEDRKSSSLICNLHLFAADSSATLFKADVTWGDQPGQFKL